MNNNKSCFNKIFKLISAEYDDEDEQIFEGEEGYGLKYDLPDNTGGYMNIWIEAEEGDGENEVCFKVFNVTGLPVTDDSFQQLRGVDFYERYAYDNEPLAKVIVRKDGSSTIDGDTVSAEYVISKIASLY